ncbi:hypothetical protein J7K28_06655 [Candidatus Aerophobetes bacterium]|nr:hypothetical protein [Candidatus Aerophobetes bacterium]
MNEYQILKDFERKYGLKYIPYPQSVRRVRENLFFMAKGEKEKFLIVGGNSFLDKFEGEVLGQIQSKKNRLSLKFCKLRHNNLKELKKIFPHLSPSPLGIKASFGTGDRLGITTPAHIRAIRGHKILPIFAQQSIREINRTKRTLEEVMDDALWGCFQEGYEGIFGADADHIKTREDLKKAVDAGYSMFTIDPSDLINDEIPKLSTSTVNRLYREIKGRKELEKIYRERAYEIDKNKFFFKNEIFQRIVTTYAKAIEQVVDSYQFLRNYKKDGFDFEISVDETSLPTTILAHIFITEELHRNGVNFSSLALRFIGDFQKAIDYIGDTQKFGKELELHTKVCKKFGGYKLSLHSGSDKFSIYGIFKEKTDGLFHIKTSGTSWLEAVRVIARKEASLFKKLYGVALNSLEKDRFSYHVKVNLSKLPKLEEISNENLETLLNKDDVRQLLHITYGSILNNYREEIYQVLFKFEDEYYDTVSTHIDKHLCLLD